jgi:hypothetical protein
MKPFNTLIPHVSCRGTAPQDVETRLLLKSTNRAQIICGYLPSKETRFGW